MSLQKSRKQNAIQAMTAFFSFFLFFFKVFVQPESTPRMRARFNIQQRCSSVELFGCIHLVLFDSQRKDIWPHILVCLRLSVAPPALVSLRSVRRYFDVCLSFAADIIVPLFPTATVSSDRRCSACQAGFYNAGPTTACAQTTLCLETQYASRQAVRGQARL